MKTYSDSQSLLGMPLETFLQASVRITAVLWDTLQNIILEIMQRIHIKI